MASTFHYHELHNPEDFQAIHDLEMLIWDMVPGEAVSVYVYSAVTHNGGVLLGAFDGETLIGFSFGIPGRKGDDWYLWSHISGVAKAWQGHGVGFALKQKQREWALAHGYQSIRWTFDPMQSGNANFNIHHLGAVADVYTVNHYGVMRDGLNVGLPSDRLEARWVLNDDRVRQLAGGELLPARSADEFLLRQDETGALVTQPISGAALTNVEIPCSLAMLKTADMARAQAWQAKFSAVMQAALGYGYTAVDFVKQDQHCWYVLQLMEKA